MRVAARRGAPLLFVWPLLLVVSTAHELDGPVRVGSRPQHVAAESVVHRGQRKRRNCSLAGGCDDERHVVRWKKLEDEQRRWRRPRPLRGCVERPRLTAFETRGR